jgi:hypothetical protein
MTDSFKNMIIILDIAHHDKFFQTTFWKLGLLPLSGNMGGSFQLSWTELVPISGSETLT